MTTFGSTPGSTARRWDDASSTWCVRVTAADGATDMLTARAVISRGRPAQYAVHSGNRRGRIVFRPRIPQCALGSRGVGGRQRRGADRRRRVGGFQIAPAIAGDVNQLSVFQRSAQWMFPNPNYHEPVEPGVRWAMRHLPFYARWYRFLLFWPGCDKGLDAAASTRTGADQDQAVSDDQRPGPDDVHGMDHQPGRRRRGPTRPRCCPTTRPPGKRTLQDNGSWLRTLTRDNVELVRTPIDRIDPDAVVTSDGARHPADIVVYATGFRATDLVASLKVIRPQRDRTARHGGETGRRHTWASRFRSSRTSSCSTARERTWPRGQPDLSLRVRDALHRRLSGPADRVGQHAPWSRGRGPLRPVAPPITGGTGTDGVVAAQHQARVFKNADGQVHSLSPWRLVDFWTWTRSPEPGDFTFS